MQAAAWCIFFKRIRHKGTEICAFFFVDYRLESCICCCCFHFGRATATRVEEENETKNAACMPSIFISLQSKRFNKKNISAFHEIVRTVVCCAYVRTKNQRSNDEKQKKQGKRDTIAILWPSAVIILCFLYFSVEKRRFFWQVSLMRVHFSSTLCFLLCFQHDYASSVYLVEKRTTTKNKIQKCLHFPEVHWLHFSFRCIRPCIFIYAFYIDINFI